MYLLSFASKRRYALVLSLALSGCATFSNDGGFAPVAQVAQQHIGKDVIWQRSEADQTAASQRVAELLASPLSVDDAVQIALLNNRGLQANFFELGISESDVVQAGRLPNPGFTFSRTHQGGGLEIDRSIVFNLAQLITMPATRKMEQQRFEQTRHTVIGQMLSLASETRKAYYSTVAADQTVQYRRQVKEAADAGSELAKRLLQVGNFNQLQRANEQNFFIEATLNLTRAEQLQKRNREKLTRLLGQNEGTFTLPPRLPDLPKALVDVSNLEQLAMSQRLDVHDAVSKTQHQANNLGFSKKTSFINAFEVGGIHNTFADQPPENGYVVSLEIPLFDWGDAKVAKAESTYMRAVNNAAQVAINARSEVREAYAVYRSNYEIAQYYQDEVVPLVKRVSKENLLRYNGMLISVFDLLSDARSQITTVNSAIEASRDFWLAKADLDMSLLGQPIMSSTPTNE